MVVNAILNTGILIGTFWTLGEILKKPTDPNKQTQVALMLGDAKDAGGDKPHIAIWDDEGSRVGQYKGQKGGGFIDKGTTFAVTIDNKQNGMKPAQPAYISLVMNEVDAICLAAVIVSGNSAQWTWTGDMGFTCGAQWYNSQVAIGGSNVPLRCVWLDKNHTKGIVAKGLSLHIRDFTGDPDLLQQYNENQRRMCQNTARMTFQPEPFLPDSMIKFFSPPLKYTRQGEPKPDSSGGAPLKPNQGIDRKTNAYPDGTDMKIGTHRKMIRGEPLAANETYTPLPGLTGVKNPEPFVIIESHLEGHSAKELCEHPMSLGPDFVSVTEKIMCDMETEKWWPLCDEGHTDLCFDLEKKVMRPASEATRQRLKRRGEVVPGVNVKEYSTHKVWKK